MLSPHLGLYLWHTTGHLPVSANPQNPAHIHGWKWNLGSHAHLPWQTRTLSFWDEICRFPGDQDRTWYLALQTPKGSVWGSRMSLWELKRNFCPSLQLPRKIWNRGFAHNKLLSEITSFDLAIGEGKLLFTKGLLFLSSCNDPLRRYFIPRSGCLIYLNPPLQPWTSPASGVSDSLVYVGFPYMCMY